MNVTVVCRCVSVWYMVLLLISMLLPVWCLRRSADSSRSLPVTDCWSC